MAPIFTVDITLYEHRDRAYKWQVSRTEKPDIILNEGFCFTHGGAKRAARRAIRRYKDDQDCHSIDNYTI